MNTGESKGTNPGQVGPWYGRRWTAVSALGLSLFMSAQDGTIVALNFYLVDLDEPPFEHLRSDPRFRDLLAVMGTGETVPNRFLRERHGGFGNQPPFSFSNLRATNASPQWIRLRKGTHGGAQVPAGQLCFRFHFLFSTLSGNVILEGKWGSILGLGYLTPMGASCQRIPIA